MNFDRETYDLLRQQIIFGLRRLSSHCLAVSLFNYVSARQARSMRAHASRNTSVEVA
jgi:hypothetical protein